ncbi:MAG: metal-dependent hydrolase [bacterium]|nr:metal-dependent hydrolase [bacterium]
MFIVHTPAGYVLTSLLLKSYSDEFSDKTLKRIFYAGIVGSVFPDLDLFYFYLIDQRQHLHHSYWIHIPFYWLLIIGFCTVAAYAANSKTMLVTTGIVGANIFLHLVLDTLAGKIRWFYPFSRYDVVLVDVTARYQWWVWNFVLHWTFMLEGLLLLLAAVYWRSSRKSYLTHVL